MSVLNLLFFGRLFVSAFFYTYTEDQSGIRFFFFADSWSFML